VSQSISTATTPRFQGAFRVVADFGRDAGGWRVAEHPRLMADVNNDGRDDIVGFGNNGVFVSLSTSTASTLAFAAPAFIAWRDQVYSVWRNFTPSGTAANCRAIGTGFVTPSIVCSVDGGANWTGVAALGTGDFPRMTVAQDGFVYVAYRSGNNLMMNKFSSCTTGLVQQVGFPVNITSVNDVTCPVPGLDRCNNGNNLSSTSVAVDDTNPAHIYVAYATNTASGNEDVVVRESFDGGETWTDGAVVNSSVPARRFMPWVCATNGTAVVSWYDRRTATAANNDLTDFYVGSADGSEINLSVNADPQCASGWRCNVRSTADSDSCSIQPQLAGVCTLSGAACDFDTPGSCPQPGDVCQIGGGCPKYGDYNANACAAGRVYAAWASATAPPGLPIPGGINVFASTLDMTEIVPQPPQLVVRDFGRDAGGWRVAEHPRMMADVNNDGRDDIVAFGNDGVFVSLSTSTATAPSFQQPPFQPVVGDFGRDAGGWRVEEHPRMMADVNNDGRDDIVGFGNDGVFVSLSTSTAITASFQPPQPVVFDFGRDAGGWRVAEHPRLMADVNNDGRDDIVAFGNDGAFVSLSTSTATTPSFQQPPFQPAVADFGRDAGGWRVAEHPRLMADVNNDGAKDIVGFGNDGVFVSLSTSNATTASFQGPQLVFKDFGRDAGGWRVAEHPRLMADVNNDGRNDIVGFGNDGVFVSLSTSTATVPSF
jgi:hypothetical protein